MITGLDDAERLWLAQFFGVPNEALWSDIEGGTASRNLLDATVPWVSRLRTAPIDTPIILPFYQGGEVVRWYATAASLEGEQRLKSTVRAWFGASYLSDLRDAAPADANADAMRRRFGRRVYIFTGPDKDRISDRLSLLARLEIQRPIVTQTGPRPVGRIRADLERALLARDEAGALSLIDELRGSGRLNEENLQYLDIRFKAGLGQWEQIARDHWTIKNLADLPLPPQILSDLIEALYRVYIDDLDLTRGPQAVIDAFEDRIARPFPKLFSSRHGVRTPRVVKAFILFERMQSRPNLAILSGLEALLPAGEDGWIADLAGAQPAAEAAPAAAPPSPSPVDDGAVPTDEAESAFDDSQYDRAFELFLIAPLNRKSLNRLLACARFIGTDDANTRLVDAFDTLGEAKTDLPEQLVARIEALRVTQALPGPSQTQIEDEPPGWMRWARRLAQGDEIQRLESEVLDDRTTWEIANLRQNSALCSEFSDLIGNLSGPAANIVRGALPLIVSAFFPDREPTAPAAKPIAGVVLLLIAMEEAVAKADLDILSTVLAALLELGLSSADYLTALADLEAVQARVSSYANLAWSLDISEALAVAPTPSPEAREARLRFFVGMLGQSRAFAHRIAPQDFLAIEYLARDYGVDPAAVSDLAPAEGAGSPGEEVPDLSGKTVGIYTLTEAAGARAKALIQRLFSGCIVEVNSDTVSTSALTNLARTADIFVFVWRSSSHQAFFCVKDALGGRDPFYATGKGTASIVNAVLAAAARYSA